MTTFRILEMILEGVEWKEEAGRLLGADSKFGVTRYRTPVVELRLSGGGILGIEPRRNLKLHLVRKPFEHVRHFQTLIFNGSSQPGFANIEPAAAVKPEIDHKLQNIAQMNLKASEYGPHHAPGLQDSRSSIDKGRVT
jgi:hypothetical protein